MTREKPKSPIHILGICGTFMGGLAILASELKYPVSGSDANVYPPMSTQLEAQGISLIQGFEANQLDSLSEDSCIVVGNMMSRGYPVVEALLNRGQSFVSGPQWLADNVLAKRHVLAVSGTHGKTTTASMLAWILEYAGKNPGFLIGGVPNNFGISARLGEGECFVVEADEYDSAFFDKRSKFIHYRPHTLIINNIEFDHADIFANLDAIKTQFHHLVRIIPNQGLIVYPEADEQVLEVLGMGCWTPTQGIHPNENPNPNPSPISNHNQGQNQNSNPNQNQKEKPKQPNKLFAANATASSDAFDVYQNKTCYGRVEWTLLGQHNIANALASIAAAQHVGVEPNIAISALKQFKGVKRRLEIKGVQRNITVYDDFAHHPTAIATTLAGLRAKLGDAAKILAVLDIRSNTMRAGHHKEDLPDSVQAANEVYYFKSPDIQWNVDSIWQAAKKPGGVFCDKEALVKALLQVASPHDHVIFMSNGGFGGIHMEFLQMLRPKD